VHKYEMSHGMVVEHQGPDKELILVDEVKLKKFTGWTQGGRHVEARMEHVRRTDREFDRAQVDRILARRAAAKEQKREQAQAAERPRIGMVVRLPKVRDAAGLWVVLWEDYNRRVGALTYKVAPLGGTPNNSYRYRLTADQLEIVPLAEVAHELVAAGHV